MKQLQLIYISINIGGEKKTLTLPVKAWSFGNTGAELWKSTICQRETAASLRWLPYLQKLKSFSCI